MATVITSDKHYSDIAAKIRERAETDTVYKPSEMATGVDSVYGKGIETGAQTEYDRFWNEFQDYGERTDYTFAFRHWSADYIRPKYKVENISLQAQQMFQFAKIKKLEAEHFDLAGADKLSGTVYGMFNACKQLEEIEDVGIPATNYSATWYNCTALRKIAIIRCVAGKAFNAAFQNCEALEDVTFTGEMSMNGLDLRYSTKLNRASIESVINVLSSSTSGRSVTLSEAAVNTAFETSAGATDESTSPEWAALIATKSNWTISLI
ncbi:MAG: hypothetical protein IJY93_08880 [Clostridia bacterium]|nr:hypothetical protein [Clostridia bacterium]